MLETSVDSRTIATGSLKDEARANLAPPRLWQRIVLVGIILLSIFMNLYQLGQNGFGNLYYAAGIKSMSDNLHNFFFVSFDPGSFVTIDKPPLGFWLQVLSVKIVGFTPFGIFLPQALAGVGAVLVLYILVKRHFGVMAGLLAALALAVSPISVVTNRNNTIDSTLALTMLLGAWAVMRAAETGRWRWLLLAGLAVGLGFNVKMLEAYLVVPAFGLLYLVAAPRKLWMRLIQLLVVGVVMIAVSFSWAFVVDHIPASARPYVGSSQDNSEISLALGYNGAQRLLGRGAGNGGEIFGQPDGFNPGSGAPPNFRRDRPDFRGFPGSGGGNGGGVFGGTGDPGLTRLFNEPLGGQIAWLLPIALLALLALAWQGRPHPRKNPELQSLLLWGGWLLTMGIFFSVAGFFHQYYMTVFAPAICALFGIGLAVMWRDYQRGNWRGWLLPLALLATALEQIHIITSNPAWGEWLIPLIIFPCSIVALLLIVVRFIPWFTAHRNIVFSILAVGLLALLLTPFYWSAQPALQDQVSDLPIAGPTQQGRFAGFGGSTDVDTGLISYLEANQGKTTYLLAVPSSNAADAIILTTNKPVMALGGFSGADPILTISQLQNLIHNGTVRFFLLGGAGGGRGGFGGNAGQESATGWVEQHCATVDSSLWQSSTVVGRGGFGGASTLYDCATIV